MLKDITVFSVKNLKLNKVRSFLSVLWIIIWVFTIILVNAIWNWVDYLIKEQLKFLNVNSIIVEPTSLSSRLKWEDLEKLLERSKYIWDGTPMIYGKWNIRFENETKDFNILWGNENFLKILNFNMKLWEFISKEDIRSKLKVAVIWKWVIENLFKWNEDVIWKSISVNKKKFKIIWIIDDIPSVWWFSFNDSIILPYSTADEVVLWDNWFMILFLQVKDIENVTAAVEEVKKLFRNFHNLKKDDSDDFNVYEQKTMISAVQLITKAISFLLIWVATIILIVSWIWIMNIMFASVAERKKEIWISRAVWATQNDIIYQFLIEWITLTIVWWIIWIIFWEWTIYIINKFSEIKLISTLFGDLFALGFAIFIWVIFWIFPAKKAAKLDPVVALN